MGSTWKIVKESLSSEVLSISGGTVAGLGLAKITGTLEAFPGMIIMVPGFMALRGNILGALAARIGTALHTGLIEPKIVFDKRVKLNILISLILSTFVNMMIGIFSYLSCIIMQVEGAVLWKLALLGAISGAVASILVGPFVIFLSIIIFKKGVDPDNVMGPIVTSIGDITAVISLFLVAQLILWVS